jgi:hypothetical protein
MPEPATAGLSSVFWADAIPVAGVEAGGPVVSLVAGVSSEEVFSSPVSSSREAFSWAAGPPAQELRIATVNIAKKILVKICSQRSSPARRAYNTGHEKQQWGGLREPVNTAL